MDNRQRVKVVLLGSDQSGKTGIAKRVADNSFKSEYTATIGATFATKRIESQNAIIETWDAGGQPRFKTLLPMYTRNTNAVLLVYDMTDEDWLNKLREQVADALNAVPEDAVFFIVGTKKDLLQDADTLNQKEEALRNLVSNNEMLATIHPTLGNKKVYEATVSAKTGEGVNELFEAVGEKVIELRPIQEVKDDFTQRRDNKQSATHGEIATLAELIDTLSGDDEFWRDKVGAYAREKGVMRPDGVKQTHEEHHITDLQLRLKAICRDADYKSSFSSLTEWFHSFFRSRHSATEEYYQILRKLDNFTKEKVSVVTKELKLFKIKYSAANHDKKSQLKDLINEITSLRINEQQSKGIKEINSSGKYTKDLNECLNNICSVAASEHTAFPKLHAFFGGIDPKTNELYGILKELKELDNHTVDQVTKKLLDFKKTMNIEPSRGERKTIK